MKKLEVSILALLATSLTLLAGCQSTPPVENPDEFSYIHNWSREGIGAHAYSGATIGPVEWYVIEGLASYVRTLDKVELRIATSIAHKNDLTTVVKIRDDVYWHTGEKLIAKDIWSFYIMNNTDITNYLDGIIVDNDTQLTFRWNERFEPADHVKTLLLAQDQCACVPYSVFSQFVDINDSLLKRQPANETNTPSAFNKTFKDDDYSTYLANFNSYKNYSPSSFPGTGPYVISTYNTNEMIMVPYEKYWDIDNLKWKKIKCYNEISDLSLQYSMATSGTIDYLAGTPTKVTIRSVLDTNSNLAFYKLLESACIGVKFNMQNSLWTDEVREAFEYVFDREAVRDLGNPYGQASYHPMVAMAPSECKTYMSKAGYETLNSKYLYSHDEEKAQSMLEKAGWNKASGAWYKNGNRITLTIGYDGSNAVVRGVAEAVQSELASFGLTVNLKRASDYNVFYTTATQASSPYDLTIGNTEYNFYFAYPGGSFQSVYVTGLGAVWNVSTHSDKYQGLLGLELEREDGTKFEVGDVYGHTYFMDDDTLTSTTDDMVLGLAKKHYGIQMFQNAAGAFFNTAKIDGLPYTNKISENRDIQYIPEFGTDDYYHMAKSILYFDVGTALYTGELKPFVTE